MQHRGRELLAEPPDAWGGRTIVEWAERVAAGARFDPAADRLVAAAEAIDAIYGRRSRSRLTVFA